MFVFLGSTWRQIAWTGTTGHPVCHEFALCNRASLGHPNQTLCFTMDQSHKHHHCKGTVATQAVCRGVSVRESCRPTKQLLERSQTGASPTANEHANVSFSRPKRGFLCHHKPAQGLSTYQADKRLPPLGYRYHAYQPLPCEGTSCFFSSNTYLEDMATPLLDSSPERAPPFSLPFLAVPTYEWYEGKRAFCFRHTKSSTLYGVYQLPLEGSTFKKKRYNRDPEMPEATLHFLSFSSLIR